MFFRHQRKHKFLFPLLFAFAASILTGSASAELYPLSDSLVQEVLSESVPTGIAPADFRVEDFRLEWVKDPVPGVEVRLGRESLEWVRVGEVLLLPRARLILTTKDIESGMVRNAGYTQPLAVEEGQRPGSARGTAEIPVALMSSDKNLIEVSLVRGGKVFRGQLRVRFNPVQALSGNRVYTDHTCSEFDIRSEILRAPNVSDGQGLEVSQEDDWIFIGCRKVYVEGDEHRTFSAELYVYWDGVGEVIRVGGVETPATLESLWPLRIRSEPSYVDLQSVNRSVRLNYRLPPRARFLSLSLGVGPYDYTFRGISSKVETIAPLLTFYASYFFTETVRLVAFNAMPLHSRFYSDFGVYVKNETFRALDKRLSLSLMLGGHLIAFRAADDARFRVAAPQGFEMVFSDFLAKRYNLAAGAFIYPPISGRSYYNAWLRYGTSSFFGEFNYISWREPLSDGALSVYTRSAGISFGFPIGQLF